RLRARPPGETESGGGARAVQQGVDHQHVAALSRPFQPELLEQGKLLAPGIPGFDRQAAGGEPVALSAGNGAEVAGAEKGADLVVVVRPVDRVVHPEAGKPDVVPRWRR